MEGALGGKDVFEFGISGLGIGRAVGWGWIVADTGAGWYGLYLKVKRLICL